MKKFLVTLAFLAFICINSVQAQQSNAISRVSEELEKKNYQVAIYPNPATEFITIRSELSDFENVEFEIFSLIGNKVTHKVEKVSEAEYRIPVREYASGHYLLIIKDSKASYRRAFKFQKVIR